MTAGALDGQLALQCGVGPKVVVAVHDEPGQAGTVVVAGPGPAVGPSWARVRWYRSTLPSVRGRPPTAVVGDATDLVHIDVDQTPGCGPFVPADRFPQLLAGDVRVPQAGDARRTSTYPHGTPVRGFNDLVKSWVQNPGSGSVPIWMPRFGPQTDR